MTYLDDYSRIDAVNISTLKELIKLSPKHYRQRLLNPPPDKPDFAFGRLVHCATVEPDQLAERYAVEPEFPEPDFGNCRKVANRRERDEWRAANGGDPSERRAVWIAEHPGIELVSSEWWARAQAMAAAVHEDELAASYLTDGSPEVVMTWQDEETSVACKGRVDWLSDSPGAQGHSAIVGLKTTKHILPRRFANGAMDYGYSPAWAFYSDGYLATHGTEIPSVEIVVEKEPPYDVVVYRIPEEEIEEGRIEYRDALQRLDWCRRNNKWPGVSDGKLLTFQRPKWAQPHTDDDLEGLELVP